MATPRTTPFPRVAVIGAGWVTGARHLPALRRSRRCEILGVVDRSSERARALARKHRLPHAAASLEAPWLAQADAVSIGVSPMAHFEVARTMLQRGKHVLLEKPLCLTVAEGETLAELAQTNGRVLAVVHNFQFARSARAAQAAIAAGRWGEITGLHAMQMSNERRRLPDWYEQLPGGLFYDESPHLLYLLRAFGGQPALRHAQWVASSKGRRTPALVQAQFDCERCPATLWMNFEAPVSEWYLMIFAQRGLGIVDIFRDILHFVPNDGRHGPLDIARSSWSLVRDHVRGFWSSGWRTLVGRMPYGNDEVMRRFFDAVEGIASLTDIGPEAALEVLRLQHALLEHSQPPDDHNRLRAAGSAPDTRDEAAGILAATASGAAGRDGEGHQSSEGFR